MAEGGADASAAEETESSQGPTPPKKQPKHPCGACLKGVTKATKSLQCGVCDLWFHYDCAEGMTPAYYDNCAQMFARDGYSGFFCKCCRKVTNKLKTMMKEMREEMDQMSKKIASLEKEREKVSKRVVGVEEKAEKVKEDLQGVEKEVENGMKTAKEEAKKEMKEEMREQEVRSENIALYGLEESVKEQTDERNKDEKKKVEEMIGHIGVPIKGDVEIKYRAGKKNEGAEAKPRPLIVRIADEETREKILRDARKLSNVEGWKRVFVSPDLTWQQREEGRKIEKDLREQAEKKTEEAAKEGKKGKYIVVGPRGRRRTIWVPERE